VRASSVKLGCMRASVLSALPERLRRQVSTALPDRLAGSRDLWQRRLIETQHGSGVGRDLPAGVARPETAEDVVALVEVARREGLPLVPFGAGSGVCGAIAPDARTLVVDTKRMRSVERRGDTLVVGPGTLGILLEESLARKSLTLGHFPSSILCSTVGGWVAARGAGQCSGRYGKIEDMLLGADCVLGTGELVGFRRRTGGLDLLPLLVGSEGTLGILTSLTLRLLAAPAARAFRAFELPDLDAGVALLRRIYQSGLRPAIARLYDPLDSALLRERPRARGEPSATEPLEPNRHTGVLSLLGAARALNGAVELLERTLLTESKLVLVFEGQPGEVEEDAQAAGALARELGGTALGEAHARAWFERRYAVSYEQSRVFRHDAWSDTLEVAAPWSQLTGLYHAVRRAVGRRALVMAHFSHAYPDGCSIYFTFLARSRSGTAVELHRSVWRDALTAALEASGTISHHHGVGRVRAEALSGELGTGGLSVLRALKRAWDPDGVLCPGSPLGEPPDRGKSAALESTFALDAASGLVRAPGTMPLAEVERELSARGRTLGLSTLASNTVDEHVARGMPGAREPLEDPVAQRLAGFGATLPNGELLSVRVTPRRATGPDSSALFVGALGRVGRLEHAVLPAPERNAPKARRLAFDGDVAPPVTPAEARAFERILSALASKGGPSSE
jgi:alkyldihydroxyacetonephosphate synthase